MHQHIALSESTPDRRDCFNAPGTKDNAQSQDATLPLLDLLHLDALCVGTDFVAVFFGPDGGIDRLVEDLLDAFGFFGAAFHVRCPHLFRNGLPLFRRYRSKALCP